MTPTIGLIFIVLLSILWIGGLIYHLWCTKIETSPQEDYCPWCQRSKSGRYKDE